MYIGTVSPDTNDRIKMNGRTGHHVGGLVLFGDVDTDCQSIFTEEACQFVAGLVREFGSARKALLRTREQRQEAFDQGQLPGFLPETLAIRESDWQIREIPRLLRQRRVEITGPVDRKTMIDAMNADVGAFMADFEDATVPTWENIARGQVNLRDAVQRTLKMNDPVTGQVHQLYEDPAMLMCRIRGMHLSESNVHVGGLPMPACLMDFGLYVFHNAKALVEQGQSPHIYLSKLQSYQEAAWWADVFRFAEIRLGLEMGTIKATILIETLPAAFEMDEILYAMREHVVALNCGRWDYIFSYIKTLRNYPDRVLPDRRLINMAAPFLEQLSSLLVQTCRRRGAMAIGGMSAHVPSSDVLANQQMLQKVISDKRREVAYGYDGTWIAHPGLAETVKRVFDDVSGGVGSDSAVNSEVTGSEITEVGMVTAAASLLTPCEGACTEEGLRLNIRIAVQYLEAWLGGTGCVLIYGLMEDTATAEICRSSLWQWIHHEQELANGKQVTVEFFRACLEEEMQVLRTEVGHTRFTQGRFQDAARLLDRLTSTEQFVEFLTVPASELLIDRC